MTTQDYIDNNRTETLKNGDLVVMVNCGEAEFYKGTQWVCRTESYIAQSGCELVFLEKFSGAFLVKYLNKIT